MYVSRNDSEVKEKILVTFNAEISNDNDKLENILKSRGFLDYKLISTGKKDVYYIQINDYESSKKVLDQMEIIEYYEKDFKITFADSDNTNTRSIGTDWKNIISLNSAWNYSTGSSSVLVGIIDSGINAQHPDLVGKVSTTLSKTFIDDDANGPLVDTWGHGTAVGGMIGAIPNNNLGIDGVCQNVTLVSLKVCISGVDIPASKVVEAIGYAKKMEIPILNFSGSWIRNDSSFSNEYDTLKEAIKSYNGLLICSSGNSNKNMNLDNSYYMSYPTGYNLDNVISVGGSTVVDTRWDASTNSGSNYSSTHVDLFAPGVDIEVLQSRYQDFGSYTNVTNGTSFSAPMVAGVAALLKSYKPSLTTADIKNCIIYSVDKLSALSNVCKTGGRLNAYKALSLAYHTHSYTYTNSNAIYHKRSCTGCHYYSQEEHVWTSTPALSINETEPNYIPGGYRCNICGAVRNDILRGEKL